MHYIYKITSPSGKVYIGKHSWCGEGLDSDYFCSSCNPHFWRAVEKYGIENFQKEIIEIVDDASMLPERETYWIQYYFGDNCYNLNPQGGGGWSHLSSEQLSEAGKRGGNATKTRSAGIFKFDEEERLEICKKGGNATKEQGLGFFGMSHDDHVAAGKKASEVCRALGVNAVFGASPEEKHRYCVLGGVASKEQGAGIFGLSEEEQLVAAKMGGYACKEKGVGIFALTSETRSEFGRIGGKIAASVNRQNGTGVFGFTHEQCVSNGKKAIKVSQCKIQMRYNWYFEGELVYVGRKTEATKISRRLGQIWVQGDLVC